MPLDKPTPEQLKALAHPLRMRMMKALGSASAGSPAALARAFTRQKDKVPVNLVAYHMHELENAGLVELVGTQPRRGSTEHYYRALYTVELVLNGEIHYRAYRDQMTARQPVTVKLRKRKPVKRVHYPKEK